MSRLDFAAWTLGRTTATLARWAYTDGTVFYLARSQSELEEKQRGSLGPYVWRQANGKDALYEDCVGLSLYWKAQGTPVRIWGLLVAGILFITVLPDGQTMNRWCYEWIVNQKFPVWLSKATGARRNVFLVQDHERCLWAGEPRNAMHGNGIELLEDYPKCSQDQRDREGVARGTRAPGLHGARGPRDPGPLHRPAPGSRGMGQRAPEGVLAQDLHEPKRACS